MGYINNYEKLERVKTCNEKQRRATKDQNEYRRWKTKPGNEKIETSNKGQKNYKLKQGFSELKSGKRK